MAVVATGSVAFDYILTFKGHFADHILPDKKHILNLSFLVDTFEKRRGGVAGNYAYNLWLLGYPSAVLATAGEDGEEYRHWLSARGIDVRGLRILPNEHTATGFTTTDLDDNQLTGYYGGAMGKAAQLGLADTVPDPEAVIVGPNAPDAMVRLVKECRQRRLRWVYDPAHQLPHSSSETLIDGADGAWILIGNDYELQLIEDRTGKDLAGLLELAEIVVTTLGRDGSLIQTRQGTYEIPVAPPVQLVDPTGAGDAYRSGLVAGLLRGLSVEEAGRVAALVATCCIEHTGTIEHSFTREDFGARYREAFAADLPPALFAAE
jgi:adenosine kinase